MKDLLALPKEQRRYRSVWAAFMLGRCKLDTDPAEAVRLFEQTRALAKDGCRDSLGLAKVSLGWQARAETRNKDFLAAIHHYFELCLDEKDHGVFHRSLRVACARALSATPLDGNLARDPLCRRLITAWVLSYPDDYANDHRWADAIDQAGLTGGVEGADRLAWLAYESGKMGMAARWVDKAPHDSVIAQWVKAKILLREGKTSDSLKMLTALTRTFPDSDDWSNTWDMESPIAGGKQHLLNDQALLLLGTRDYVDALDGFMKSGYWLDAAYLADRVLTTPELERYVSGLVAGASNPQLGDSYQYGNLSANSTERIRYLLARRLTREGNYDRASAWYPDNLNPLFQEYVSNTRASSDTKLASHERAEHLSKAAHLARDKGMELLGTEIMPDYAWCQGEFDIPLANQLRRLPANAPTILKPSPDELKRMSDSAPRPDKRFHYRFLASELMWKCAGLLPDNDPLLAQALYNGGVWIDERDTKAADKFYKALVRRCPKLPIGQEADRLKWFPKTPDPEGFQNP